MHHFIKYDDTAEIGDTIMVRHTGWGKLPKCFHGCQAKIARKTKAGNFVVSLVSYPLAGEYSIQPVQVVCVVEKATVIA